MDHGPWIAVAVVVSLSHVSRHSVMFRVETVFLHTNKKQAKDIVETLKEPKWNIKLGATYLNKLNLKYKLKKVALFMYLESTTHFYYWYYM